MVCCRSQLGLTSSLRGQYWIVTIIGVAWMALEVRQRVQFPLKTVLSNSELFLKYSKSEVRYPIGEIAGVGVARRSLRGTVGTWHVWQPACWTVDGSVHVAPGVISFGRRKSTEAVLRSHAGKVAQDLYKRLRGVQGDQGLIRTHRSRADGGSVEVLIEILDYPMEEGRWWFRWDAAEHQSGSAHR